jgi:PBP1b-binding outer membrane lipoprotein LpoB
MKRIILIIGIAILFLSCSNDETENNCNCNAWVRLEEIPQREVIPLELNCETNEPINLPQGYVFLGCDNDNTP